MPRISVVMPVYDVAPYVEEALASILAQTFRDLEVIVLDDGSTDGTARLVETIAARDGRVVVERLSHRGLAATLNHGFERVTGEFTVVADGDDVILPGAFAAQVDVLDRHPETMAVAVWNRRFGAKFFLDRMPTEPKIIRRRLRRTWVLANPMMYRTSVIRELGGAREGMLSEDWDMWMRIAKRHDIRTVPEFLALVRARSSSMTIGGVSRMSSRANKQLRRVAAMRVLGPDPVAILSVLAGTPSVAFLWLFERFLPPPSRPPDPATRPPTVSVVVPTYGRPELLARCLQGVAAQVPAPDEVVVVHRPEDRETVEFLRGWTARDPQRHRTAETGFGLVNALIAGTAAARGDVVAYLDDDAVPKEGWIAEILRGFLDPRVGAVGGRLVDHVDGRPIAQHTRRVGVVTWYGRIIWGHNRECDHYGDVDWLTGSNMAIRRSLAHHDGNLLHQSNGIAMANDLDVCLGVRRAGYRVLYSPWAVVEHHTTSFRDSELGSRVEGDDVVSSAANHAYVLLKHLPARHRPFLHLYGYLLGSASLAGPFRVLAELPRNPRRARAMAGRMPLIWRGRRLGARRWRQWKRSAGDGAPPAHTPQESVSTGRRA